MKDALPCEVTRLGVSFRGYLPDTGHLSFHCSMALSCSGLSFVSQRP